MAVYTIADIDKKVDEKFEPTEIDMGESGMAVLNHPIRLPKDRKARFKELMSEFRDLESSVKGAEQVAKDAQAAREAADAAAEVAAAADATATQKSNATKAEKAAVAAEKKAAASEAESEKIEDRMAEALGDILRAVLVDPTKGDTMLKVVNTLERRMAVLELYMKSSQAGEASPSPS